MSTLDRRGDQCSVMAPGEQFDVRCLAQGHFKGRDLLTDKIDSATFQSQV